MPPPPQSTARVLGPVDTELTRATLVRGRTGEAARVSTVTRVSAHPSARPQLGPPAGSSEGSLTGSSGGSRAVRVRLDLAYDGTDFAGWAAQPGLRTVQGTLEAALATVLRVPGVRLTVAGRTDAGVHARGQVAHVDVEEEAWAAVVGRTGRPPGEALLRRLTGILPPDVVVHRAEPALEGFDARFSALHRRYAYRLCDHPTPMDPLRRHHVVRHRVPLDADAMALAARPLVGCHDFAAFCKPRPHATTIRTLQELVVDRPRTGEDEGLVVVSVRADAFCHSMVRSLVGALMAVGEGRRPTGWPIDLLRGGQRAGSLAAPAHGLSLEGVTYPPAEELAARAVATRARRVSPGPVASGVQASARRPAAPDAPDARRAPHAGHVGGTPGGEAWAVPGDSPGGGRDG